MKMIISTSVRMYRYSVFWYIHPTRFGAFHTVRYLIYAPACQLTQLCQRRHPVFLVVFLRDWRER